EIPNITLAVDAIVHTFSQKGRLIYIGAGTSGRLGVLDASECPPTYNTDPNQIIGIIAGGHQALTEAIENAEDNQEQAINDLKALHFSQKDILVGIAASGQTPYVISGLQYAKQCQASTIAITCSENNPMQKIVDIAITPIVGAEIITGSTRMKAGTAQKMILNMLTTTAMIKMGKVYGNLMVDVQPNNAKLIRRQQQIVCEAAGCSLEQAKNALNRSHGNVKAAIIMLLLDKDSEAAQDLLEKHRGHLRQALSFSK
ncbi:N-acetylmuramic acid 6-phosphate etherase, partial [Suttonella ornithocola]